MKFLKKYSKKYLLPLIIIIILLTLLKTSNGQQEKNETNINNTDINKNNDTNTSSIKPIPDTTNKETENKNHTNITINTNTTYIYDPINDKSVESENIEIKFYKSEKPRTELIKGYKGFIELKDEFYRETFKQFNYKYMPENKEYNDTIDSLSILWFISAGFIGFLFILYFILRFFFGKFKGAKEDNLHEDDKWLPWSLFGKI